MTSLHDLAPKLLRRSSLGARSMHEQSLHENPSQKVRLMREQSVDAHEREARVLAGLARDVGVCDARRAVARGASIHPDGSQSFARRHSHEDAGVEQSVDGTSRTTLKTLQQVQGLLEIKDTYRPRVLR